MAHYQNQYGAVPETDQYGNPINPIDTTTDIGGYTTGGQYETTAVSAGAPVVSTDVGRQKHHGLHRSGCSSSSSSSEDDGFGGRRKKKGLKDKIKGVIPGTHSHDQYQSGTTVTTTPVGGHVSGTGTHVGGTGTHVGEKKGMIEKIKEKLPGGHKEPHNY